MIGRLLVMSEYTERKVRADLAKGLSVEYSDAIALLSSLDEARDERDLYRAEGEGAMRSFNNMCAAEKVCDEMGRSELDALRALLAIRTESLENLVAAVGEESCEHGHGLSTVCRVPLCVMNPVRAALIDAFRAALTTEAKS